MTRKEPSLRTKRSQSRTLTLASLTILLFLGFALPLSAVTVGFEGVAPPGASVIPAAPYVESGFTFTSTIGANGIFDSAHPTNDNGSAIFGWCAADCGGTQVITVTAASDFSISSIDISYLSFFETGMFVNLKGNFSGGGFILASLPVTSVWATHGLAGFAGLSSLEITAVDPNADDLRDSAIDNLVMAASTVPEPVSLLLLSVGIGVCSALRRSQRST